MGSGQGRGGGYRAVHGGLQGMAGGYRTGQDRVTGHGMGVTGQSGGGYYRAGQSFAVSGSQKVTGHGGASLNQALNQGG